jgi:hypothetical protein
MRATFEQPEQVSSAAATSFTTQHMETAKNEKSKEKLEARKQGCRSPVSIFQFLPSAFEASRRLVTAARAFPGVKQTQRVMEHHRQKGGSGYTPRQVWSNIISGKFVDEFGFGTEGK